MRLATLSILALILAASTALAGTPAFEERVTNGVLDLVWAPGFNQPNTLNAAILAPSDLAFLNPSGDHTVGVLTNASVDSGGVALSCTDPGASGDYTWEADIFTGAGNTRRGLVLRADASQSFTQCYQFVMQAGLLQFNFRKLVGQTPTTLGTWFSNTFPGGIPAVNTWHHMKVTAIGNTFKCYFDGYELTQGTPILDSSFSAGWVGVYNFSASTGQVPVYFDDLALTPEGATPTTNTTWGAVKARWR
jgi:hypothetical protein